MKVLVVGSLPPPASAEAEALLAEVVALRAAGHDVETASPSDYSVAHRTLDSTGLGAAIEVARAVRGVDAVVIRLEPGLPVRRTAGRVERALALLALGAGLRTAPEVRLRLDHAHDLPRGPGGRAALELWKSASSIEAGDEATAEQLRHALGEMAGKVALPATSSTASPGDARPGDGRTETAPLPRERAEWGDGADVTAETVMTTIRRLAAAERTDLDRRARERVQHQTGVSQLAPLHVPGWQWLPAPGAGVPALADATTRPKDGGGATLVLARRIALPVLAAAERRRSTRPFAHLARGAWGRWRSLSA